ncbi:hypothetical protein Acr_15g0013260 [Actinidia rufa]|uniref:Reverse transcriptase Ty1/copia-type domain-containing protein n=1 Tax=Actinidia rufa TaxID=165716 RepID=A0A7J0FXR8_9ERIC|nr:hypothetical protein Acr_15g0013260 [Actinidia rufa]
MAQPEVSQPISIILDESNYRLWSSAMQRFLRARKLWKYITGSIQPPHFSETDDDEDDDMHAQYQSQLEDWDSVNSKIITWFSNTSVSSIHSLFTPFETAKEVWDYLAERYSSVDGANEYQLGLELHHLRFDPGQTLTEFYNKMSNLWNHLAQFEPTWTCPTAAAAFLAYRDRSLGQALAELRSEETRKKTMVYQHSQPVLATLVWAPLPPPSQSVRVPNSKNIPSGSQKKYCSFCRRDTHSYEDCRSRPKSKRKGYHNRQTAAVTDSFGPSPDSSSSTLTATDVETIVTRVLSRTNIHSSALSTTSGTLPWLFDTACCNHMTSDTSLFSITHPTSSVHPIHTADGPLMTTTHTGTISTPDLTVDHTYLDPRTGKTIGTGHKVGRLFELESLHAPHRSVAAASSSSSHVSFGLWHSRLEAALTAVYTINRTPSLVTDNISPYEKLYSTTPNYALLRVFGSAYFVLLQPHKRNKLEPRSRLCCFLGYGIEHKGYRYYDPISKRLRISRHVEFWEDVKFSDISKSPTPSGLGRPLFTDPSLDIVLPVSSPSSVGSSSSPILPSRIMAVPDTSPPAAPPSVPCLPVRCSTRLGFSSSTYDSALFLKKSSKGTVLLLLYVDDMIITGDDLDGIATLKKFLSLQFEMKDLGNLSYFLGIEVSSTSDGYSLSQTKYASELLSRAGLTDNKTVDTPLENNVRLNTSDGEPLSDPTLYRQLVGSLIYLTVTRPDISHAVHIVSQFMSTPRSTHYAAALRILRYVKGAPTDRRSTTGYCFFLGDSLISWRSKKQSVVARSSTEAEYRALADATSELLWLRWLIHDLGIDSPSVALHCDNHSAIQIAHNDVFHERTKHIEIDCHFIRHHLQQGVLHLVPVRSADQPADLFTKTHPTGRFRDLLSKLKLVFSLPP